MFPDRHLGVQLHSAKDTAKFFFLHMLISLRMQDDMQKYASNNIAEKEDFVLNFVKTRVLTPMMNLLSNQLRRKQFF